MKNNFIHVCFIIDESSSMYSSIEDVKGGFKKIIDEQKANENGNCAVSIFRFATYVKKPDGSSFPIMLLTRYINLFFEFIKFLNTDYINLMHR